MVDEPPPPARSQFGFRCPQCGSTDAGPDETRSRYDFTFMHCRSCGHGGLVDSWQRDADWLGPKAPAAVPDAAEPRFGCARCFGTDTTSAWESARSRHLQSLIDDVHYGIDITACPCGQRFAVVFTERIDWVRGEDPQDWLVVPITDTEQATLVGSDLEIARALTACAANRRFLVRTFPADAARSMWWRDRGFSIGPHD